VKRELYAVVLTLPLCSGTLHADTVELISGEVLHGTITEQQDLGVTLDHPVLGTVKLSADQIKQYQIASEDAQAEEQPQAPAEPAAVVAEAAAPNGLSQKILPGWDKHFELGFTGTDGNTQTSNLAVGFAALRENDEERTKLNLSAFRAEDDGTRTRNEAAGELTHDWLMPESPWFKFVTGKLEYDEFKDWETRASAFIGVGKQIYDGPKNNLIGRAGIGGSYEFDSINEVVPEALFGLEWVYNINERQKLTSYVTVYPDLDEFGESRTLAGSAWSIKIDEADGLSLKLGIDNEYESRTEGTSKHNDVKYYAAVVFDF
jgi:putative salt-induced outer membrane protein YdiY